MATSNNRTREVRRLHIFSLSLGVWMILAPFILHYGHTVATTNEILTGFAITVLSYLRLRSSASDYTWASWALAGAGLWLVFSPFIFGYTHAATYWNQLLFGIILIIMMFSAVGNSIRHHSHLAH